MSETTSAPAPTTRRPGTVFGLVLGLLIGALIAALVMPRGSARVTSEGVTAGAAGGRSGRGGGSASSAGGLVQGGSTSGGGAGSSSAAGAVGGSGGGSGSGSTYSGGAAGGGGTSGSAAGATARGVTANAITIGIAYPDLGGLRALGPEYDNGDVPKQWNALREGWKRQGLIPINGRDVRLVFEKYNVTDLQDQHRACIALINDDKAFAVVGVAYFAVGADCVAREFHTPLLTSDGVPDSAMTRGAPYLFSLGMSEGRLLRNLVHWADARGALKGKKIGVYFLDDPTGHERVEGGLVPELAKLGYHVAVTVSTTQSLGGPQDAVAVQRFRSRGVDLAILFTSKMGFLQQAQAQNYTPTYIDDDIEYGTSDTATSTYPAAEWDTTFGMTARRVGESAAGEPLSPQQEACIRNYEQVTGEKVARPGRSGHEAAVFSYILMDCDEGSVLLDGLKAAGPALTASSYVGGLETIRSLPMLRFFPVTFWPGKHDGVDSQRTVQWHRSCTCWVAMGQPAPLWVR